MEVFRIDHTDFELTVKCNSFENAFRRARIKQSGFFDSAKYSFSTGQCSIYHPDTKQFEALTTKAAHPVFFENKDYLFDIQFRDKTTIQNAYIFSPLRKVSEKFFYREGLGLCSGTLNFGNDLGRFDFILRYEKEGVGQEFVLSFEVFPIKLNYRTDYLQLIADIEKEYPLLVLSFLKKTYSNFSKGDSGQNDKLIWWQIFGGLYSDFIKATQFILNKPHSRLVKETHYVRADKLKRLTSHQEEEIARYQEEQPERLYRTSRHTLTTDTPENRFLKYTLTQISQRFTQLRELLLVKYHEEVSATFAEQLLKMDRRLRSFTHHPFFRSVGEFKGIRQESLVLQKANGYSTIYKCWIMLRSGISFFEGIRKLELKNIAELYEIWCFLEMKRLVSKLLEREPQDVDLAKIHVNDFTFEFRSGQRSKVTFLDDGKNEITLFHDYQFSAETGTEIRSYTVHQRPDIVLQVTKSDLRDHYFFTYLYDAKYRLQSDEDEAKPDTPPEDAINQMHRYRDAIFYEDQEKKIPEKEIIGGYVLFPGAADPENIKNAGYYKSIETVNIGAFPLRPNDALGRHLLEKHLSQIIDASSDGILRSLIPQKGNQYEPANPEVLIGVVRKGQQTAYFETTENPKYHTGRFTRDQYERFLELNPKLKYFAPYISGKGIREYYEIKSICLKPREDIFMKGHPLWEQDDSERIVFELGNKFFVSTRKSYYKCKISIYRYCTLKQIRNPQGQKLLFDDQIKKQL